MRFIDLCAGLGGFHRALSDLGHECVFASEIDADLRAVYEKNFPSSERYLHGDLRVTKEAVPPHDILCAGFPCQPFSKSGLQLGFNDETRGTLFHEILEILDTHRPEFVLLENVGNFERHDDGRTWQIVRTRLEALGYSTRGTTHRASGGHGLISPHHFGHPHHRERFFIVGWAGGELPEDPFPRGDRKAKTTLADIVQLPEELGPNDQRETRITAQQVACVDHWNALLSKLDPEASIPSVPIWGDEIGAEYPFEDSTPYSRERAALLERMTESHPAFWEGIQAALSRLPNYARAETFPKWKKDFIRKNRAWFENIADALSEPWLERLREFPPSLRKLEWNCKGEHRDLWSYVLQFRPSGLRVKRYTSIPALVAMTTTQIPILGPERRFITRVEGLRLQGFPSDHLLPASRERAFAALGNAVHVEVVARVATSLLTAGRTIAGPTQPRAEQQEIPFAQVTSPLELRKAAS